MNTSTSSGKIGPGISNPGETYNTDNKSIRKQTIEAIGQARMSGTMDERQDRTCPGCSTCVTDADMAQCCDLCDMWHHITCEGISGEVYRFLTLNDEQTIHWYCAKCNIVVGKLVKQVTKLSNRQDLLETQMQDLDARTEKRHQELRDEITAVRKDVASTNKEEVSAQVGVAMESERATLIAETRDMVK